LQCPGGWAEQQPGKNADDRDDEQQFDQGEAANTRSAAEIHRDDSTVAGPIRHGRCCE